ncbi:hypothetical protein RND81_04G200800 [Saponaria officinalis]|uniref:Uncharacterized protein n=1 Tax=Saponaria officinalis TaxID=3572 RepID=A0AAW1LMS0_SAPOF
MAYFYTVNVYFAISTIRILYTHVHCNVLFFFVNCLRPCTIHYTYMYEGLILYFVLYFTTCTIHYTYMYVYGRGINTIFCTLFYEGLIHYTYMYEGLIRSKTHFELKNSKKKLLETSPSRSSKYILSSKNIFKYLLKF